MKINVKDNIVNNTKDGTTKDEIGKQMIEDTIANLPYRPQDKIEIYHSSYFLKRTNRTDESYRRLKAVRQTLEQFPKEIELAGTHTANNELMEKYDNVVRLLEQIEQEELEIITMDE